MARRKNPIDCHSVVEMYQSGMSKHGISKILHCRADVVKQILYDQGIESRKRGSWVKRRKWTPELDDYVARLYEGGMTMDDIASIVHSNNNRVSDSLRRSSVPSRCKASFPYGEGNPSWNGGKTVEKTGYILIRNPSHPHANHLGYVREHRLAMERKIGRYLLPTEVVHHRNGIKNDNRIENLELFSSNAEHLAKDLAGRCPKWTSEGRQRILDAVRRRV